MADKKLSALTALTGALSATDDLFLVVDTSAGESKKMTRNELVLAIEAEKFTGPVVIGAAAGSAGANDLVVDGSIYLGGSVAANELDDYEEGTWTPGFAFGGASVGISYTHRVGTYTKIGNLVVATAYVLITSKGSSVGDATITGLPFTSNNIAEHFTPINIRLKDVAFADYAQGYVAPNTSIVVLDEITNAGAKTTITNVEFSATSSIMAHIVYRVA